MRDNEIIKECPLEEETAYYKKSIKEFFSRYENKSDGEDCIEVSLIRHGYRMVLKTEQEINRQKAEIERLKTDIRICESEIKCTRIHANRAKTEAIKKFAARLKVESFLPLGSWICERIVTEKIIDNLVKVMAGEE